MDPELLEGLDTLNELLAELGNPLITIRVRASKAPLPLDADAIGPEDLVECDFDGYAPVQFKDFTPILWDDPTYAEVLSPEVRFLAGDSIVPQPIHALFLTIEESGGPDTVRQIFVLPQPVVMSQPGQSFTRRVRFIGMGAAA